MTPLYVAAGVAILVLLVGGLTTRIGPWYEALRKPVWQPPGWLFGPMWTTIAALAVWSATLAWSHAATSAQENRIVALFAVNAVLHMAWSPLFFVMRRPDWALVEVPFLWLSVLALMLGLAPLSGLAAILLAPYLVWVGVATLLNLRIVQLNGPFEPQRRSA